MTASGCGDALAGVDGAPDEPRYTVRKCRGHWHVEAGEFDTDGTYATQEDAEAAAAAFNAGDFGDESDEDAEPFISPPKESRTTIYVPESRLLAATARITELEALLSQQDAEMKALREDWEWMESRLGLHTGVELLYIVAGYEVTLTERDGNVTVASYCGATLRDAIRTARVTLKENLPPSSYGTP